MTKCSLTGNVLECDGEGAMVKQDSSPGDVVKGSILAVIKGDLRLYCAMLSRSKDKDKVHPCDYKDFAAGIENDAKNIKKLGGIKHHDIIDEAIDGDNAKVKNRITFGDGHVETSDISLVKEDGTWKINIWM
jgi:hypothetical protein